MTTGGYPPQSDPHSSGAYPAPQYGGQPAAGQPADYTTHFPNPITSGYEPPQQNPPQYGAPAGGQQYGAPAGQQYGGQQYGGQQYGGQPSTPQYTAPPAGPQYGAPPQYGDPQAPQFGNQPTQQFGAPQQPGQQFGAPAAGPQYGAPQYGAPQPTFGPGAGQPGELLPRLGARIIDALIIGVPFGILTGIVSLAGSTFLTVVLGLLTGLALLGYAAYFESTKGWTLGKKVLGLSVTGPDGGLPTLEQAVKRNAYLGLQAFAGIPVLGWLFNIASLAAFIGIAVTIGQSPTKQGFHDAFAGGTQVVKS
ncbi:RDD family protein [Rhodococcus zopfii]|uniref:RDD family protein n=1 Tax=Rhodococcus zopfii TaxID=43772 RepID=UPI0011111B53|nr:RDD family protein [Rhodococcus zopfii]